MDRPPESRRPPLRHAFMALAFVMSVRLLLTLYWLARFGGNWAEDDSARTTVTMQAVLETGKLIPTDQRFYPHGFLYQIFGSTFAGLSGFSMPDLQALVFPFIGLLTTMIAFAFYLQVLKSPARAGLAAILLSLQGDFLMTNMRGTHEKLDYLLIFASMLVMVLAMDHVESLWERAALAVIYYLAILAENTSNVFFASTLTITLILSFVIWYALTRLTRSNSERTIWLVYISTMAIVFSFMVMFIWYPPASNVLFTARDLGERMRLFLLSPAEPPGDVYATVSESWIFPSAWLYLRIYDMFLLAAAGLGWLAMIRRVRQRQPGKFLQNSQIWLLILLPAFAFQNLLVIMSDITGSGSEINNLQIRLIPLTTFAAAPLAAGFLVDILRAPRRRPLSILLRTILTTFIPLALLIALIKSTSEPLLSNAWLAYSPPETRAIAWIHEHIPRVTIDGGRRTPLVWAGPDFRIGRIWLNDYWGPNRQLIPIATDSGDATYLFVSPAVRLLTERYRQHFPDLEAGWLIYDNGQVQIYYARPEAR